MTDLRTTATAPLRLEPGTQLPGSEEERYCIDSQVHAGKYGTSYLARRVSDDKVVYLKTPYIDKNQSRDRQNARIRKVLETFMNIYESKEPLAEVEGVAHVLDAGMVAQAGKWVPFLVQDYIDGEPLARYLADRFGGADGQFHGIPSQRDWFDLARDLLRIVRRVHGRFIVHGDISPDNILIQDQAPVLVDFGQSRLVEFWVHNIDEVDRAHEFIAPERLKGQSWDMPADIYSVGGVLFYLATGMPPPPAEPDVEQLKVLVHEAIRDRNPDLLRENLGIAKIIDKCLRYEIVDRYAYIDNVYDALDIFDYTLETGLATDADQAAETVLDDLRRNMRELSKTPLFAELALSELLALRRAVDNMGRGHLEFTAEREQLIDSLLRYLSVLDEGDEYLTVTIPAFWSAQNLGINGRFLTMNQMMALKGVIIRRVFLVTDEEASDEQVKRILRAHINAAGELASEGVVCDEKILPARHAKSYWNGIVRVTPEEREQIRSRQQVAIWRKRDTGELVSITFSLRPGGGQIGKIRFSASRLLESFLDEFKDMIAESMPLETFFDAPQARSTSP